MGFTDRYGLTLTTASDAAAARFQHGMDELLSYGAGAGPGFTGAVQADPTFALGHAGLALVALVQGDAATARAAAARARETVAGATRRERQHVEALSALIAGETTRGLDLVAEHVTEFPRDALLVNQAGSAIGFAGGRDREAHRLAFLERLAPAYDDDWWFQSALAFTYHEVDRFEESRRLSERSLQQYPRNANASHNLAHIFFETADHAAGAAFLDDWLAGYDRRASFHCHLAWHLAMFELYRGLPARALEIFQRDILDAVNPRLAMIDGSALLWRFRLDGEPGGSDEPRAWRSLADLAERVSRPGFVFGEVHAALAYAACGDQAALTRLIDGLRALDAKGHPIAGPVALPMVQGVAAFVAGDHATALAHLEPVQADFHRVGGSHAQWELFEETLVASYLALARHDDARRLMRRRLQRRASPRDLRWLDLGDRRARPAPLMSDFRAYLDALERAGQLVHVGKPVSPQFEVAAYVRKSSDRDGPAFVFDDVIGHPGWKLAAGLYGTMARLPVALGCRIGEVVDRYGEAVRRPIAPRRVTSGPCQEIVLTGEAADCTQLPLVVHSELDAGRYLTAGVMFGRDPETGVLGVGLQRMQLKGPRRFGVNMPAERRVGRAVLKAEDRGEPFGVAVVLGAGPFVDLGSQAKIPHAQEKLGVAGALAGRPIELVACKTVDAEVPADAEVVIEGHFLPKVREPEGPFGEVAGTYGLLGNRHVFEVSAITRRRDAMGQTALTGMPTTDNHVQAWPAICESIKRMAQLACPEVVDVHAIGPYYVAVVSIKKRLAYEARNVILSVLGPTAGAPQAKYCIVVDPDVNVRDLNQVLWAVYTRCQPADDVLIFPPMVGAPLDPSAPVHRHSSKMGFDATVPLGESRERYNRVIVPGADQVSW